MFITLITIIEAVLIDWIKFCFSSGAVCNCLVLFCLPYLFALPFFLVAFPVKFYCDDVRLLKIIFFSIFLLKVFYFWLLKRARFNCANNSTYAQDGRCFYHSVNHKTIWDQIRCFTCKILWHSVNKFIIKFIGKKIHIHWKEAEKEEGEERKEK